MPLKELLESQFQVKTRPIVNALVDQVTAGVTKIASNNPNRLALVVINTGTAAMWILFDSTVSSEKGIMLGELGGSATILWDEDFDTVGWEWYAYSILGGFITVVEIVED